MTRIGSSSSGLGGEPSDVEREASERAARGRFQRKQDQFGLGHGSGDTLGERQFRDDPHEQEARARSFEGRLADKLKGDARPDAKAHAGKPAPRRDERGTASPFAPEDRGAGESRHADRTFGSALLPLGGWIGREDGDARDPRDDHERDRGDSDTAPRILAIAEPRGDSLTALFATQATPAPSHGIQTSAEAGGSTAAERVAGIETRVEHALQQELSLHRTDPISFNIPVDPKIDGLMGLAVTVGPEALDIVLTRGGAPASEDLVRAAGALAERLQRRFTRQTVRILEVVVADDEDEAVAPAAPDGVMALFGRKA